MYLCTFGKKRVNKLKGCLSSPATPANIPSLTDTRWTLGRIQRILNVYKVGMLKAPLMSQWAPIAFTVATMLFGNLLN